MCRSQWSKRSPRHKERGSMAELFPDKTFPSFLESVADSKQRQEFRASVVKTALDYW